MFARARLFKNLVIGLCVSFLSLLFSLSLVQLLLLVISPNLPVQERKVYLESALGHVVCYSSNPYQYLPLNLQIKDDRNYIEASLPEQDRQHKIQELVEKTPYCLVHDRHSDLFGAIAGNPRKIALIGDSFTFGEGLRATDTLGAQFARAYPTYQFYVAGAPGAFISNMRGMVGEITANRPEISTIIYFYNLNDIEWSQNIWDTAPKGNDFQNLRWHELEEASLFGPSRKQRISIFDLVRYARAIERVSELTVDWYQRMYFSDQNALSRKQSFDFIEEMAQVAQSKNVDFALVIYPLMYKNLWGAYPFSSIHKLIMDYCTEKQLRCLDAYQPFKRHLSLKKFMVHPVEFHPNAEANRKVVAFIKESGLLRPRE